MGRMEEITDESEIKYFWNTSDHHPPHFHAKHTGGDWEIRVYFLECREGCLEYDYKFPSHFSPDKHPLSSTYRKEILRKVLGIRKIETDENGQTRERSFQEVLYEEWDRKVKIKENLKQ